MHMPAAIWSSSLITFDHSIDAVARALIAQNGDALEATIRRIDLIRELTSDNASLQRRVSHG